jgi:hypothetical protein
MTFINEELSNFLADDFYVVQTMNIYRINIWDPCQNEDDALACRSDPPDNKAVVFAPTKDIANQVCYLAATRDAQGQSNYQKIDGFSQAISCVLDTREDPIVFDATMVDDLLAVPILPKLDSLDTQAGPGMLFFTRCIDNAGKTRGQFWAYAADRMSANIVATEHGDTVGMLDLDSEAIRVELYHIEKTCVFWNVEMVMYELHNNRKDGDKQ